MPAPPDVNIITRYLLENPWPVGIGLLLAAAWLVWSGMRDGLIRKINIGLILGTVGIAAIAIGWFVETSGERARIVTRALVNDVVAGDAVAALAHFSNDAVFTFGSPKNPGFDHSFIQDQLNRVLRRYPIESNTITMLRGYGESSDAAVVHMACFTQAADSPYPAMSQWVVRVRRQPDGSWRVSHLTCVSINDQPPPTNGLP